MTNKFVINYREAHPDDFDSVYAIASEDLNSGYAYHKYMKGLMTRLGKSTIGVIASCGTKMIGFAFFEEDMVLTGDRKDFFSEIRRDIGTDLIWTGAAFAVINEYRSYKIGSALFLHSMLALSNMGVKHILLEIWIRPDGYMPSNTNLLTAGHYTEYGIVKDFYYESSQHGYICPVCGDNCHCSAKIAVVHIVI